MNIHFIGIKSILAFHWFVKDIVTRVEYNDLMIFENAEYERNFKSIPNTPTTVESGIVLMDIVEKPADDIQVKLKYNLLRELKKQLILFFSTKWRCSKRNCWRKTKGNRLIGCRKYWSNVALLNCLASTIELQRTQPTMIPKMLSSLNQFHTIVYVRHSFTFHHCFRR